MKKALVCGISGQDGAYLSKLLLEKGYLVFGTSRDAENSSFPNLHKLGIYDKVKIFSASLTDFRSIIYILKITNPDEVYNLSGQSSVGLSFEQPVDTFNSITIGTLNLLEGIRLINPKVKLYNAASSECFGDTNGYPADEKTSFSPRSPYAVAKSAAYWYVANYRESYNIFACSGLLFNHESSLRPDRFVTQKIITAVKKIAKGEQKKLVLGNIDISRDWGWAPEYVSAMYLMMQNEKPDDYIIASGIKHSLVDFISLAFAYFDLNYANYLVYDEKLKRPNDIAVSYGNPIKAKKELGWEAKTTLKELIVKLIEER